MKSFMKIELKRAFHNTSFFIVLGITMGICIWHFVQNVWIWRDYVYAGSYPLSAFGNGKWIGGDNASLQPTLYFLILPILCSIPYGKTFYFDIKSGFMDQLITRGKKKEYLAAKFIVAFVSGAVISVLPLLFDFLLTGTILPAIIPQRGMGIFPITDGDLMAGLFYTNPYLYLILYLLLDAVFFGLMNIIAIWAVNFVSNGFWIVLMPFLSYLFVFCMLQFVDQERFAPIAFLRPSQPFQSEGKIVCVELVILILLNIIFYFWHLKKERINYE